MRYTSDLTYKQWKLIKGYFGKLGNKSKWDRRELVNAILYLVKTGCQWRNLPKDFPPYSTVYTFFRRAKLNGTWEKICHELVQKHV